MNAWSSGTRVSLPARIIGPPWLRRFARGFAIIGAVLLLLGLQAWLFERQVSAMAKSAVANLQLLRSEYSTNTMMDGALQALQQYRQASENRVRQQQAVLLRDEVLERYAENRATAVAHFLRVVNEFEAGSPAGEEALAELRARVGALSALYGQDAELALARYTQPVWYLQPGAALARSASGRLERLRFNAALYLLYSGDRVGSRSRFEDLLGARTAGRVDAEALFALARLHYDAFRSEKDPAYLQSALDLARQSVAAKPDAAASKLVLDYLLSIDPGSATTDLDPADAQGSDQGPGERGMIRRSPDEY